MVYGIRWALNPCLPEMSMASHHPGHAQINACGSMAWLIISLPSRVPSSGRLPCAAKGQTEKYVTSRGWVMGLMGLIFGWTRRPPPIPLINYLQLT
ncbi:hypothetical protein H6P81_008376 [Aristolochia fimbriata]|uniref:Uncharacterized protein n=1 Tax=Aristolochia fimbriata TaxID=158543 RepID=A0AAV7F643_ARIFI|nr:hypothetical protein H6P81_008376 [Aristolochia fimbriata]